MQAIYTAVSFRRASRVLWKDLKLIRRSFESDTLLQLKKRLLAAFLLLAIVAGFYWKLTLTRQFDWVWGPDLATQVLPWFEEQARFWGKGTIALWDPTMWAGQPFVGQNQPGTAYPLNWILFALPMRNNGFIRWDALQWYFVVTRFMAVAFCYWLCRDLGRSRIASLLGGVIFGLGGFIGSTGWPQWVNGAVWLPLVFLFLLRASRTGNMLRNAALSGMFLGIAWLSGHHQAPLFETLAAAGAWLYLIFRSGKVDWHFVRAGAAAMLFMGLTGALQILPAYEYGHRAERWVDGPNPITWNQPIPYSSHEIHDLKPVDLVGIVFPYLHTNSDPFVGVAALALAFLGLAICWRDHPRVRLFAAAGLGGLVYALGQFSVFQGLLYGLVPELDKARTVSAAIFIFQFGIAVLAAFGVDQLGSSDLSPWRRRVMWALLSFAAATLTIFQAVLFSKTVMPGPATSILVPFLAFAMAALLYASIRGSVTRTQTGVLMVLLVLMELGNNTSSVIKSRTDADSAKWLDQMRANADVAEFLKHQPGFFRATVANGAFVENWGEYHGVDMWQGYLASVTLNMRRFEYWKFPARMLFGVAYTIADKPPLDGGEEVFAGVSGMKVYRYKEVFRRTWAVHQLRQVHDAKEGDQAITNHLAELHDMAFLFEPPPPLEACGLPDDVELREHTPNRVSIEARMSCQGMVILSDTFFPGWHATIDGNPASIYEVNEAMRGVVVPTGVHTLTFQYRPFSVIAGFLLTLVGVGGAVALALGEKIAGGFGDLRAKIGGARAVANAVRL
jgi:hypothetical protein